MKKKIFIAVTGLLSTAFSYSNGQNVPNSSIVTGSAGYIWSRPKNFSASPNSAPSLFNYDRTYTPLVPLTVVPDFEGTKYQPILVNTSYLDGRGSPLINVQRNNTNKDIVTPLDNRVSFTQLGLLPYTVGYHSRFAFDAYTAQTNYYGTLFTNEDVTAYSLSQTGSTAGMPTTFAASPGLNFVGSNRGTSTTADVNDAGDNVYIITYSGGNLCKIGAYAAGELWRTKTEGQHGQLAFTWTNKSKQVVCKRVFQGNSTYVTTYYVYNEEGKLIFIIPPKATAQFSSTNNCISDIDKLCYSYVYDEYGNLVNKSTPGKSGTDDIVYDQYGTAMMSRSPLLNLQGKWAFSILDKLGRVVMTGLYTGSETQSYFQGVARGTTTPDYHSQTPNTTLEYWLTHRYEGDAYPSSLYGSEILTYNYYDSYTSGPAASYSFNNGFSSDYLGGAEAVIPVPYLYGYGQLTATKVKILSNGVPNNFANSWITTVCFYDELGRMIQTQVKNPWNTSNIDISTTQYNFSGNPMLNIARSYSWTGNNKTSTTIWTRNYYNSVTGRLEMVKQKIDSGMLHPITYLEYDDLGRVKRKSLGDAENQYYTYNIRGQLIGINASNINSTATVLKNNEMSYLSEIHYDDGFSSKRYDGGITGYIWRTSSMPKMAYGYGYDDAARMTHAEFREYTGTSPSWNKTDHDYTVSNITYDYNGNILTMNQRGPTSTPLTPDDIDQLSYTYDAGNQLQKVTDAGVASPIHDFDNGTTGSSSDYTYDADGNLASDANKTLDSIRYNFQDLPLKVFKQNGDSISNTYDATGNLLQKIIFENGTAHTYRYWGNYVYYDNTLQYVLHPEGRARWLADSSFFKYDFFVKDHFGNIRTVITADLVPAITMMHAGFEIAYANIEEAMFDNISEVRDNSPTGVPGDLLSARLNGSVDSTRIGAAVLMHVMAGDELNFQAYGYYEAMDSTQLSTYAAPEDMAAQLVTTLVNGGGNAGLENANPFTAPTISTLLSPENYSLYEDIKNNITDPNYPRAYLNYLVFNEDMQLLPDKCIVVQLKGTTDNWHQLTLPASQPIEENGYALCYLSNETAADVFMDNASMVNIKGRLLEENLYYPHGLLVDLGRQASLSFENKYLYQGKSLQSELELELYDFHARQYDPQIGRFWGIDPADQFPSGYTGMGNDPANNIDPSGMYVVSTLGGGMEEYWAYNRQLADEKAYADAMEPFAPLYSAKQMADEMMNAMYNAGTEETDGQFQEQESIVDKVSTAINAKSETEQKDPASEENQLKKFMETLPEGTRELFEKSIELVKKKKEQDEEKFYGAEVQGDKDKKTSNQEAEGKIDIYRTWETDKSTTSTFTTGDGSVKGFILEPAGPSTTERNTDHRIPEGTYSTKLEYSPHFKRMLYTISNNLVPPDRRVLIHSGNGPNDTEACLIPGSSRSVDRVWGSKETLRALMQYIGSFKGNVKVTIHDPKRP